MIAQSGPLLNARSDGLGSYGKSLARSPAARPCCCSRRPQTPTWEADRVGASLAWIRRPEPPGSCELRTPQPAVTASSAEPSPRRISAPAIPPRRHTPFPFILPRIINTLKPVSPESPEPGSKLWWGIHDGLCPTRRFRRLPGAPAPAKQPRKNKNGQTKPTMSFVFNAAKRPICRVEHASQVPRGILGRLGRARRRAGKQAGGSRGAERCLRNRLK